MSQSDIADTPCLKFYFLYNPNMLRVLQLSMHICTCICPSALVVAAWHGNYSSRQEQTVGLWSAAFFIIVRLLQSFTESNDK